MEVHLKRYYQSRFLGDLAPLTTDFILRICSEGVMGRIAGMLSQNEEEKPHIWEIKTRRDWEEPQKNLQAVCMGFTMVNAMQCKLV